MQPSVRKGSSLNLRKSMLPPINNEYDADTFYIRHDTDFPRGNESTYAHTVAEGDLKTLSRLHSEDRETVYQPEYISTSHPLSFHEMDSADNTWIRVFGYVPEDTSRVMQELQRCGYIADSRSSMANYMYVRYNTQLEVERALALNGTRVNGNYIGVVRCTWEEVRDSQESNINKIVSSNMDTRDYVVHENEIYKRAPVKRFSLCTWISEWLFGFCPVFLQTLPYYND